MLQDDLLLFRAEYYFSTSYVYSQPLIVSVGSLINP